MLSPDSKLAFSVSPESEGLNVRKVKVDSKGRISIPSEVRKNFGLEEGSEIELVFDLKENLVMLFFGQDSVTVSTEACGAPSPGSKESMTQVKPESSETPGPSPEREVV